MKRPGLTLALRGARGNPVKALSQTSTSGTYIALDTHTGAYGKLEVDREGARLRVYEFYKLDPAAYSSMILETDEAADINSDLVDYTCKFDYGPVSAVE